MPALLGDIRGIGHLRMFTRRELKREDCVSQRIPREFTVERAFTDFEALTAHADIGKQYDGRTAGLPAQRGAPSSSPAKNPTWSDNGVATRFSKAYTWRGQRYVGVGASIDKPRAFNATLFSLHCIDGTKLEPTGTRVGASPEGMLVDLNLEGSLEIVTGSTESGLDGVAPFEDFQGRASI